MLTLVKPLKPLTRVIRYNADDILELVGEKFPQALECGGTMMASRNSGGPAQRLLGQIRGYRRIPTSIGTTYKLPISLGGLQLPGNSYGMVQRRAFSSTEGTEAGDKKEGHKSLMEVDYDDYDDYDDYEEPQTAGGRVAMYFKMLLRLAGFGLFSYCFYITAKELLPSKMSPNRMYNDAFELLKTNAEIQKIVGEDPVAFGRSAGRRHFDSREYEDIYGNTRTRIRFNMRGKRGQVLVWCEMSKIMNNDEPFVYLVCQDRRTGEHPFSPWSLRSFPSL